MKILKLVKKNQNHNYNRKRKIDSMNLVLRVLQWDSNLRLLDGDIKFVCEWLGTVAESIRPEMKYV